MRIFITNNTNEFIAKSLFTAEIAERAEFFPLNSLRTLRALR
jgi:hypothetical protein